MIEKATKTQYRIRNWSKYNAALKRRGSLTFWIDDEVLAGWWNDEKTGKGELPQFIARTAISTMSTMGSLFNLARRQTQGFMESLFELMGVELSVPDHSTVSRRLGKISVSLPIIEGQGGGHVVFKG